MDVLEAAGDHVAGHREEARGKHGLNSKQIQELIVFNHIANSESRILTHSSDCLCVCVCVRPPNIFLLFLLRSSSALTTK